MNRQEPYRIPTNYTKAGKVFRGMIPLRNMIDAVILGIFGVLVASLLPLEGDAAISGYILIIGLFAVVGIIGIQGTPVSVYVIDAVRWLKRRKHPFLYNFHGGTFTVSAADVMLSEPQLRDSLADAIDKVRAAMAPKKPVYIEGETFQFADDPELERLKAAQRALDEENESEENEILAEEDSSINTQEPAESGDIDINSIIEHIVLHEEGDTEDG